MFSGTLMNDVESFEKDLPSWIKYHAGWWADGEIDDDAFVQAIQYLVKKDIIQIPESSILVSPPTNSKEIPTWIKNNADWWGQGLISDDDFLKGIQYLVENRIIIVSSSSTDESIRDKKIEQKNTSESDFSLYENSLIGIKINYPVSWVVTQVHNSTKFSPIDVNAQKYQPSFTIGVVPDSQGKTKDEVIEILIAELEEYSVEPVKSDADQLSGKPSIKIEAHVSAWGVNLKTLFHVVTYNDEHYSIGFASTTSNFDKYSQDVKEMLESLEFTN